VYCGDDSCPDDGVPTKKQLKAKITIFEDKLLGHCNDINKEGKRFSPNVLDGSGGNCHMPVIHSE
jgi:hypothetical protein